MKTTKVIGPVEIYESEVLGTGSSGSVFKGKMKKPIHSQNQTRAQQLEIAVKVIPHEQRFQNQVTEYLFESQKEALIKLTHPNVIQCFGIYEDKINSYYATEFIRGGTLKDYIKQKGLITEKQAVYLLKKLLNAVTYINNQGFIHRDLKPANVMVKQLTDASTQQKILEPVIIDFGYAERLQAKWKPQMFYNVGSPSYMAPQSYKQTSYTQKSDLWALGVIFFQMLTGDTFDSNVKIQELFRQPEYYIEKSFSQKSHCLSTRSMKILRNILIVNEANRPNLQSMLKFVSKIEQTYRIPQHFNQREGPLTQRQRQQQPVNKNLLVNLKNYQNQERLRMSSFTVTPQNNQIVVINQKRIYEKSPQHNIVFHPQKQVQIIKKIRSERVLTNPIEMRQINNSFIQPAFHNKVSQLQKNLSFKRSNQVLNFSNVNSQNLSIRRNYHSPSPNVSILNPETKKMSKITFHYRSPSRSLHQSLLYSQVLQK